MNKALVLQWIPNVFVNNVFTLLYFVLLVEAVLFLARVRSNNWKFWFRILPFLKVALNLFSYQHSRWSAWNGLSLPSLPKNSRFFGASFGFSSSQGIISDFGFTTEQGYQFGLYDLLAEHFFPFLIPTIAYVLLVLFSFRLIQFFGALTQSIKNYRTPHPPYKDLTLPPSLKKAFDQKKISIEALPKQSVSPYVIGLFRPKIRLPQNLHLTLSSSELHAILTHELAHIKRYDLFTFPLLHLLSHLFFLPLSWLKKAAEKACDEWALKQGVLKKDLAHALAKVALRENQARAPFAHPFVQKNETLTRIKHMNSYKQTRKNFRVDLIYTLLLALMVCFISTSHVGHF